MPSLPAVFVELKADASKFMAAMKSAQDEIKKTADVAQTNSDKMANVGKIAFAGLSAAAVGFGAVAVKAALEGEQAHAQLVQAVQNSGTAFSSVGGKVDEMSGKFAKLGYENDAVETALTRLVTASGSTKTAMDNMGLAADLARARHISLEDAAGSLGKVLAGNMKGMTAFGLSAKDAAGNTLTTAEAVKELNERFGGAAAANANTYAGRLQALNAEWHNMIESVGNMLLPVLANLAGHLADVAGWFEQHKSVALALAGVIGGPLVAAMTVYIAKQAIAFGEAVAAQIGNVAKAIFALVPAAEAAEGAEAGLASMTALATGGLSILGAGIGLVAAHFMSQSSATDDAASAATNAQGAVDGLAAGESGLGDAATGATGALKAQTDLFKQLNNDTDAQSAELVKLVGDQQSLNRASQTLNDTTKTQAQNQRDATKAADNLSAAQKKLNDATDTYNKLQAGLGQKIASDQNHAHHDLEQAQLSHEEAQTKLTDAVRDYGANSQEARQASLDLESATFTLTDAQEAMGHVGEAAWTAVDQAQQNMLAAQTSVTDATDKQTEATAKLNKPVSDLAANTLAWQQATNTLNADWTALEGLIAAHPEIRTQLVGQVKALRDNLPKGSDTKPFSDLLDKLTAPALGTNLLAINAVAVANAWAHANAGPKTPAPAPSTQHPSDGWSSDITFGGGAADGAVVRARPGGKLMVVGEGGRDEAIIPLNKAGGLTAGAGMNVQIIINGNGRDDHQLAVAIRDELVLLGRSNGNTPGL